MKPFLREPSGGRRLLLASLAVSVCLSFANQLGGAETQRVKVPPGLIELRCVVPAGADVSWEARQPLDLGFKLYEGGQVLVCCKHDRGTMVLVSDVIDWESRKRDKTTWIVEVNGTVPPDPEPEPEPDPQPETFAAWVQGEVSKVSTPARGRAAAVGSAYAAVADRCGVDLFTPAEIREATKQLVNAAIPQPERAAWKPFFDALAKALLDWDQQGVRSWADYQATWRQITEGMR